MTALALLTALRRRGVKFIDQGGKLQVITPKGVELSDTIKNEVRRHKDEILRRLRCGGITVADVTVVFPGATVSTVDADLGTCARCARRRWWVSLCGIKVCAHCFPPASPAVVAAWVEPGKKSA
jgi:hypothetical protein